MDAGFGGRNHEGGAVSYSLYLGDCLEYMKSIPDKSVDAIITDLPYGTTACSWDEIIPFEPMWEQVKRIDKGVFVTTASQPFTSKLVMSNLDWFKCEWIYEKNRPSNIFLAKQYPLKYHENILVFSRNGHNYNPQMTPKEEKHKRFNDKPRISHSNHYGNFIQDANLRNKDTIFPNSIIKFNVPQDYYHPTQKPLELYRYLICTYTNEDNTVLDICMGSGTTGVACMQLGRNFIGCEIDPGYYAIAEKRIKQAAAQMLLPLEGG